VRCGGSVNCGLARSVTRGERMMCMGADE
jgi:hypothetical protein